MKEKLYTIPVHDAFQEECECPVCSMYRSIEQDALRFTMSGYMVEERRMESNRVGFCERHMKMLYEGEDRLGLAWMIKTHMEHIIGEIEKRQEAPVKQASFFKKKAEPSELTSYLEFLDHSCFVCDKINAMFERYLVTIFYLYKKEEAFRGLFRKSKGFCTEHYRMLAEMAPAQLGGELLQQFMKDLNILYLENMKRAKDDVSWFIDKFDYRFKDEPWKNAKDSIPRAMTKLNGIL